MKKPKTGDDTTNDDAKNKPEKKTPLPPLPAESPRYVPAVPDESQSQSQQTTWHLGCKQNPAVCNVCVCVCACVFQYIINGPYPEIFKQYQLM